MPILVVIYVTAYPIRWESRSNIFGVAGRDEYRGEDIRGEVAGIVKRRNRQAFAIILCTLALCLLFTFLPKFTFRLTAFTALLIMANIVVFIPYVFGNKEMKEVKLKLHLKDSDSIKLVDLSNVEPVHGLSPLAIIVPNAISFALFIAAFLFDLNIIKTGNRDIAGSYLASAVTGTFAFTGVLLLIIAFLMDGFRNEIISADSTVNVNYNRAKKKNNANSFVIFSWINTAFVTATVFAFMYFYKDWLIIVSLGAFVFLVLFGAVVFALRDKKIESFYEKDRDLVADDDAHWIGGMIYYNPKDKRLNVNKRVGVGSTINAAHPVGKIITVFIVLSLVVTLLAIVWLGMMEALPTKLMLKNDKVVCHQISDDYEIPTSDIKSIEFGENVSELKLSRVAGVGMPNLLKGNFIVNGEKGCRVFLNKKAVCYVKIETDERTYYFNGESKSATKAFYESLADALKLEKK